MAGDGTIDGKFVVGRGQGISQAIRDELGLTQEECNKLGKSVWTQIFEQVKAQDEQTNIYDGGSDPWGNSRDNFKVYKDQTIEFSKEIWSNIVKLVNDKLGKNIQVSETTTPPPADPPINPPVNPPVNPPAEGEPVVNTEQAKKDAEAVKVTVPKPYITVEWNDYNTQSKKIAKTLKDELQSKWVDQSIVKAELEKLKNNPELAAMVVREYGEGFAQDIDDVFGMGFGFNKKDFYNYVLAPLVQRAEELGINTKGVNSKSDIETMDKMARELAIAVYNDYTGNAIKADNEWVDAQNTFNDANNFLAEVANMTPPPEMESGTNSDGENWKKVKLPDGRGIAVYYDESGEIKRISISHDTTLNVGDDGSTFDGIDIQYTKDKAQFDTDKSNGVYEGSIDKGYDFDKLKALAEKIFGKWEADE